MCDGPTPLAASLGEGDDSPSSQLSINSADCSSHYLRLMPLRLPVKEVPLNIDNECAIFCLPSNRFFSVCLTDFNFFWAL